MKNRSINAWRFAVTGVALACGSLLGTQAWALGLGRLSVQSALGEVLRAEVDVTSITPEEASSLRVRVASPDAYRAAGVEYNAALGGTQVQIVRRADGTTVLRLNSERAVLEPFVEVILEATWASGRVVREYTVLLDPPGSRPAAPPAPPPATAPLVSPAPPVQVAPPPAAPAPQFPPPAPVTAPPPATEPAPSLTPPRPAPRAATRAPARPATAAAPVPARAAGIDEYKVKKGDVLSRIAERTRRQGVSLDQMLVSLFRANPEAFSGENMNRLKAGAVLTVPSADEVGKVAPQEARDLIVAQATDFDAYRRRLAAATTATTDEAPPRQASGRVQTRVEDRKQAAAPSSDKLTLSQGTAKPGSVEARTSRETERRDSSQRLAELSRNVEELRRLQEGTSSTAPARAPATAPATPPAAAPVAPPPTPPVAAAPPAAPATTTPPVAAAPATPPAPAAAPAATPAATVPLPPPVAAAVTPPPTAAASAASAAAAATVVAAAASAPPRPAVPTPPVQAEVEPSFIDSLLDNAMLLPGVGVLVALLAGVGLYRLRSRMRKASGETSFLESRLQPDSFFGASGGQRVDTREAQSSQGSSSMSYSLSQLDAIGDVDPVAEADVYLAYGRDLQAEEILKEAMRASPDRLAVRTKLLEVYAKRRDAKGFELLATQLFSLTHGEGEEWTKAQALGLSIDPDNPLYQPGGRPDAVLSASGKPVEPLSASTMPYTAPAAPPTFQPAPDAALDHAGDAGLDLDLDLVATTGTPPSPPRLSPERTQPLPAQMSMAPGADLDLELDPDKTRIRASSTGAGSAAAAQPAAGPGDSALDFDISGFALDLPASAPAAGAATPAPAAVPAKGQDFAPSSSFDLGGDPLERKLELAEEFRQIGDLEGARDLLEEVLAKADGTLRTKAQTMLDRLK